MAEFTQYNIEALISRRKELKLSQADLAKKSGVSYGTVQAYEQKKFKPTKMDKLAKICAALDMPVSEVIQSEEIKVFDSPLEYELSWLRSGGDPHPTKYGRQAAVLFALEQLNDDGQQKAIELLNLLCKIPDLKV